MKKRGNVTIAARTSPVTSMIGGRLQNTYTSAWN
jgi:hypothetical protein